MSSPNDPRPAGDYLRNPLHARPGVCGVCRGPADPTYQLCYACGQHARASQTLADAIFPIAYCAKDGQHYEDLKRYKNHPIMPLAQARLRSLVETFLDWHIECLTQAAGGKLTHLAVVPSTRRQGPHPLAEVLGIQRQVIAATGSNPDRARRFSTDTFTVHWSAARHQPARVLLFDDTWTTGASLQSFAYGLKQAGATSVVGLVLGRLLNADYAPSRAILSSIRGVPFSVERCASPSCHG
ncbi:hypothetical protein Cs7R123_63960 [Catellatospora sp. TT07R-123]|uniref:hypothetical protein n=1 Tax=Catellatospora sp. TT07R-123 TaxID=2733863 RepID=UPI001B203DD8|nr:hypothetical protein [Catellatospora sp. TT07R-123]GHJ49054.1 hypothetical protein Cs7R123_63960 [Catellatospora sp. TT07R-123]